MLGGVAHDPALPRPSALQHRRAREITQDPVKGKGEPRNRPNNRAPTQSSFRLARKPAARDPEFTDLKLSEMGHG